jgi:peptide/nickel transport system permease protein
MQRYVLRRFIQGIVALMALAVTVFILVRLSGDPLDMMLPVGASDADRLHLERALGLDRPYHVQFYLFIVNALKGDFGESIRFANPASELFFEALPNTLILLVLAFSLALSIAIPLGVIAAVKRDTIFDRLARGLAVLGMATPTFWMGMRLLRSAMLDVLDSEYIKLARIKGVKESAVIWRHALRNALITLVSFVGVYFAYLITGAIVVESIFAWPGVGRLVYQGVLYRDFPLVQCILILKGVFIILFNIVIDIVYAYLDPRIRYQ